MIIKYRVPSGFFANKETNTFTIDGMNTIRMKYGLHELNFLVDTGASVSIIFSKYLKPNQVVNSQQIVKINGINGYTHSIGTAIIDLQIQNYLVNQKFLVVSSSDTNFHGILGTDFLLKHKAIINYENFSLSLSINNNFFTVDLQSSHDCYITIPSRCETIKYFPCEYDGDYIILSENLADGVYVASCIVRAANKHIPVKILNVNDREIKIKNFQPAIQNISHFHLYTFDSTKISVERVDKVLDLINIDTLNSQEKNSIEKICAKYADVFHLEGDKLSVTNLMKQSITLSKNASPVYVKPYRLPHVQKDAIDKQINKLLKDDIIEETKSPWSSPILVVPKKADNLGNKKWRMVIDFRQVNKQIADDKFPLPNITEIIDSLSRSTYFSHLDLSQGYYQVELDESSKPITAFSTNKGQYQLKRLPMGLKISPSAFSRIMTLAMSGLNYESCFVYLDDLVVFGSSLKQHNANLVKILERLRKVNLKLNPSKCEFLKKELLYLGHVISSEGVSPDPSKIETIKNYPVPKSCDEVKRFVAFANYYRKFIRNFADIVAPLNQLTRKHVKFEWKKDCQRAFDNLKQKLINPPILEYPNFSENNKFHLRTDASGFAIGAVLANSNDKPIAFASKSLNKAERNYCTIEKELLAIVWAVKYFRPYLFGKKFKIFTDHKPLIYLFSMTNPSSRLTKFRLLLEEYDFEINYVKGKDNVVADALSRITSDELKELTPNAFVVTRSKSIALPKTDNLTTIPTRDRLDHPGLVELFKKPLHSVELRPINTNEFEPLLKKLKAPCQSKYVVFDTDTRVIYIIQNSRSASAFEASLRDLKCVCNKHNIQELCIIKNTMTSQFILKISKVREEKLANINISIVRGTENIVNKEMRQLILNDFHMLPTGGHAGIRRMYNNIKKYYYWTGLALDVENFVKRCDDCQRYKHVKMSKQPLTITSTASSAFEKIFLDIVGPLNTDNDDNRYILTIQCELTKFVECYPITNKDAQTVSQAYVNNFILRYGIPKAVVTDQGTEFMSKIFKETCKLLGIEQLHSTAYHHETLGAIENTHKHLGTYLRIQLAHHSDTWSSWVPFWCFSFNNTVHTETKYSPYELVFGKNVNLPSTFTKGVEPIYNFDDYVHELKYRLQTACTDAKNNLINSKIKRKENYDKVSKQINYKVGDKVLVRNETGNKLEMLYKGPYRIEKVESPNVVIKLDNKLVKIHKNRIKWYQE